MAAIAIKNKKSMGSSSSDKKEKRKTKTMDLESIKEFGGEAVLNIILSNLYKFCFVYTF